VYIRRKCRSNVSECVEKNIYKKRCNGLTFIGGGAFGVVAPTTVQMAVATMVLGFGSQRWQKACKNSGLETTETDGAILDYPLLS
jgi:hypothetical protein